MASIAMQVDIAAPVDEVFAFVADYRNALHYMHHFHSFRPLTTHTYGLGAVVRASGRLHGIPITTELQIVEFEMNRRLVSKSRSGVRSTSRWQFEPNNEGTTVTFFARYDVPHVPLAGRMIDRLIEDDIRTGTRRTLEKLKQVLESRLNGSRGIDDE